MSLLVLVVCFFFFFQAEDGIRDLTVTGVQTCALPIFEAGSGSRKTIEAFFVREQIAPKVVTETENVEIIKALVMVGMGMAILPYQAVAREVRAGQLFCSRIAGVQLVRETGWVHLRLDRVPRAMQEMMRTLERVRPKLKLTPGPAPKTSAAREEKSEQSA